MAIYKNNENRQKMPEIRHLSQAASDEFTGVVRPISYAAAKNLQNMVKVMVPEYFDSSISEQSTPAPNEVQPSQDLARLQQVQRQFVNPLLELNNG